MQRLDHVPPLRRLLAQGLRRQSRCYVAALKACVGCGKWADATNLLDMMHRCKIATTAAELPEVLGAIAAFGDGQRE